jgi:hypothetical protein
LTENGPKYGKKYRDPKIILEAFLERGLGTVVSYKLKTAKNPH